MSLDDEAFLQLLREAFAIEAAEHLQAISAGLLELEGDSGTAKSAGIIEGIFREAHSLKGAARSVNRSDIEGICQALESIFAAWKSGAAPPARENFDLLSRAVDRLDGLVKTPLVAGDSTAVSALVRELRAVAFSSPRRESPAPPETPRPKRESPAAPVSSESAPGLVAEKAVDATVRIARSKMDALLLQAEEMMPFKRVSQQRATDLREIGLSLEVWQKEWAKVAAATAPALAPGGGPAQDFLEWNHSFLCTLEARLSVLADLAQSDSRWIGGLINGLLEDAKNILLLPFSTLLDSLPKLVRDLARDQGKEVEFVVSGRDVEVDKRLLDGMKDPLVHLLRNAIDHGIENPSIRAAKGKPARAVLTVAVSQLDSSRLEIVVSDDGAGIALEEVRAAAIASGAVTAAEAAAFNEPETLALIFRSGVSTTSAVTEISGRGLGMAIAREKVEKLGGRTTIETMADRGTTFRIALPVTLATFQGVLVSCGGQEFIVPHADVERVLRVRRDEVKTDHERATISYSERQIPLARLEAVLGLAAARPSDECWRPALLLGSGDGTVAFAVDEVVDELEVLVKPLPKPLLRVRNFAGATVLGSGKVALILNAPDLLRAAARCLPAGIPETKQAATAQTILVADDSVTSRMLLENILASAGYKVRTAMDGMEAWMLLKSGSFDLVVSDVEMPRMNGFDLTKKIREDRRLAEIPVVLVTGIERREHRERGLEAGASAYFVKSGFVQRELLETVRRLI